MKTTRRGLFALLAGAVGVAVFGKEVGAKARDAGFQSTATRPYTYTAGSTITTLKPVRIVSTNLEGTDYQSYTVYGSSSGSQLRIRDGVMRWEMVIDDFSNGISMSRPG